MINFHRFDASVVMVAVRMTKVVMNDKFVSMLCSEKFLVLNSSIVVLPNNSCWTNSKTSWKEQR